MTAPIPLPAGFSAGHFTDRDGWTGCTAIIAPEGSVASGEVRGGGPGTRESDLLSPATSTSGPDAVLLTGGSAFGLAAADGVVAWLEGQGRGHPTPAGPVALASAAVVYDLTLGSAGARPDAAAGRAACAAARPDVARGSVGAGTGCTVGKILGPEHWTKGGLGAASIRAGDATLVAIAAVNPGGDVLDVDGTVLAGAWRDGRYERAVELIAAGAQPPLAPARANTTLVCLCTDARLTKTEAWIVARAMAAGVARAVSPCATAFDGDMTFVMASGAVDADPLIVGTLAAEVTSAAIRDGVLSAEGAPGCPSVSERLGEHSLNTMRGMEATTQEAELLTTLGDDHVATLEINRPPNNFFDVTLIGLISDALDELAAGADCRAVVLTSNGRHFCAGANFGGDDPLARAGRHLYEEAIRMFEQPLPIVAAVNGAAIGGGLGLAMAADFRVASPESRFASNFALLGFHHGFGLTVTLPAAVGTQKALDLLYTGRRIGGEQALAIGLCDRLVAADRVRDEAHAFAAEIAASAPLAVRSIRETMRGEGLAERIRVATTRERAEQERLQKTEDWNEGLAAVAERRAANFQGR